MSQRPVVTVAVSTYRRQHLLARLVSALENQTIGADSIELVVVDDASEDGTADVLHELASSTRLAMTVIVAERNGGPAVGRNRAWRAGAADLVAFTDDDCVPTTRWLEEALRSGADGAIVVGRTEPAPDQLTHEGAFSRTMRVSDARYLQTCNVLYPRAVLESLGGFEERFRTGEDTDLGMRAIESGCVVVFAPDALVHHDVRPSSIRAKLRESWTWVDLPLVVRRHPQMRTGYLHRSVFWKPSHPATIVLGIGVIAGLFEPLAFALVAPWVWRRLRTEPLAPGALDRIATLPGALLVDLAEVVTMLRGSVRHRVLVL